jgi:hypothetical protein
VVPAHSDTVAPVGVFSRRDDGLVEEARRLAGLDLDELASLLLPLVVRYDASKFGVHGPSDGELAGQLVDGKLPNEELRGLVDAVAEALQRLARFKHPKALVVLPELPRNASGKVTKGTLREHDPA